MEPSCREKMLALESEALVALATAIGLTVLPEFAELPPTVLPRLIANAVEALGFDIGDLVIELLRLGAVKAAEILGEKSVVRMPPNRQRVCDYSAWAAVKQFLSGDWLRPSPERRVEAIAPNPRLPSTDSFHRYARLRPGMRFSAALRAGVTPRDLREWAQLGDIVIGDAR